MASNLILLMLLTVAATQHRYSNGFYMFSHFSMVRSTITWHMRGPNVMPIFRWSLSTGSDNTTHLQCIPARSISPTLQKNANLLIRFTADALEVEWLGNAADMLWVKYTYWSDLRIFF